MTTTSTSILSLFLAKGIGTKTISDVVDSLHAQSLFASDLSISDVIDSFPLRPELRNNIQAVQEDAVALAERLDRENIHILIRGIDPYPKKLQTTLGKNSPPVLFAKGNLSIFDQKAVGFCGSRHASEKGIGVAASTAGMLAQQGVDVVSGYAKGVDMATHSASLRAGGTTIIVLAEGILHFRPKQEVRSLFNDTNYLVLSEFSPGLPWSAPNAMKRNSTIIGLSDVMIVIESGETGGTHACATTTLGLKRPLFVAEYAQPATSAAGNQQFLDLGAIPLRSNGNGKPQLNGVFEILGMHTGNGTPTPPHTPSQTNPVQTPPVSSPKETPTPLSNMPSAYPKRLIEVDLPISRISAHARREKSIRHGHISTLHIWWARRPLAACRAVICAALWPDPADPLCPQSFRDAAARLLVAFAQRVNPPRTTEEMEQLHETLSPESRGRWEVFAKNDPPINPLDSAHQNILRFALLDFIADYANWDNSTVPAYLETSRALTQAAHEALGGEPGTRPLVVDPFAGGGSIPLEALRVGADAFASDLNPVAVLLNKVVLEYIPKYGQKLADEVRKWGAWIKEQAEAELAEFYPKDPDGATPIAYLWARTIQCEGPSCGAEVPLMRSLWLAKKEKRSIALRIIPNREAKRVDFEIVHEAKAKEVGAGTVKRGSATCPCCGFTTPVKSVREQLKKRRGGAADARLFCVVTTRENVQGRFYRLPTSSDLEANTKAAEELERRKKEHKGELSLVPEEPTPMGGGSGAGRAFSQRHYGMNQFYELFTPRQLLALTTFVKLVQQAGLQLAQTDERDFSDAVQTCLACVVDRCADKFTSLVVWHNGREFVDHQFARQAISMNFDFADGNPLSEIGWTGAEEWVLRCIEWIETSKVKFGASYCASALEHPMPDCSVSAFVTDPPYYDAVPYADLSDFFYVWLRRSLPRNLHSSFNDPLTPKKQECIVDEIKGKDDAFFENSMQQAMAEGRRILVSVGIGIVVFAHKSTAGWEAQLQAMIRSAWVITGSWPIDTEMATRLRAKGSAALASSVHLVCRPRVGNEVGDWRDVLSELPQRMHEWMPRLASEGVVGADAIFACLGPALEIFSRYSSVEKANGDPVLLKEYLEHVWAAVSKEALSTIFRDADASGLEPDARLTAMWLWTLGGGKTSPKEEESTDDEESEEDEEEAPKAARVTGFSLEFDAARKIAQGLGIHLEKSESIVEVRGERARLLAVKEREKHLFGKDTPSSPPKKKKPKFKQGELFTEFEETETSETEVSDLGNPTPGITLLDQLHQAMILFGAQRGEALKRFLVEDGVGKEARFWKLAQSLAALYPTGTDERRWVEGVLARKKGLGL